MICIVNMPHKIVIAGHASDDVCLIVSTILGTALHGCRGTMFDGYGEIDADKSRHVFRAVAKALRDASLQFPGEIEWVARRRPEKKGEVK